MKRVVAFFVLLLLVAGCEAKTEPGLESGPPLEASTEPAQPVAPSAATVVLRVEDLTCEGCAWQIREKLETVDGVGSLRVVVAERRVEVAYDPSRTDPQTIQTALQEITYTSTLESVDAVR